MSRRLLLSLALGAELGALCGIAAIDDLRTHLPAFVGWFAIAAAALLLAWRHARTEQLTLKHIVLMAILLRVPLLFTTPSLSDDVWRYLHDGRAQRAGISPYAYAPADAATITFRGREHSLINHPDLVTIYPPVAQAAFLLNAWTGSSLLAWRLMLMAAELVLILVLGALIRHHAQPLSNLVLYAWHPLAAVEVVGSAHLEPIAIALMAGGLLAATCRKEVLAGVLTGLSSATKFVAAPLLLLAAGLRKTRTIGAAALTIGIAYALYWHHGAVFGSLGRFAVTWQANDGLYALLTAFLDGYRARIIAATLLICALVVIQRSRARDEERAGMYVFALLLLSPVVYAWYVLWLLACVPLFGASCVWLRNAALAWSFTIVLGYFLDPILTFAEYAPVFVFLVAGFYVQKKRRSALSAPPLVASAGAFAG